MATTRAFEGVRVLEASGSTVGADISDYLASQGATVVTLDPDEAMGAPNAIVTMSAVIVAGPEFATRPEVVAAVETSVVVTIVPFGATGAMAGFTPNDGSVLAAAGLSSITGPHGGKPTVLSDAMGPAGPMTTLAVVAALDERRRTGRGRRIDVTELGASLQGLWTAALDFTVNGRELAPLGARDVQASPYGVYRVKDGNWLAIACFTEEEWFALKVALGRPDWAELERMQTPASRINEQREMDHHISHWINEQSRRADESPTLVITMLENLEVPRYTSHELARYFQGFGVPAAVVDAPTLSA